MPRRFTPGVFLRSKWRIRVILLIPLFLCSIITSAQVHTVTGTVTDTNDGSPLPGVNVIIKGTNSGTTTDTNGTYTLPLSEENSVLVFSFIGYVTQEVEVNQRTKVDVVLAPDTKVLKEVVVLAFGQQQDKKEVVGSVTTVSPSELKVPSSNLTTALAGRVAGVIAYQRSGEPGLDNAEFFIRGVTTFGYKMDPLILIDGIELTTTDLARLNPDDIAGFSIMKDATSTALYGARGANGVILVTTKSGVEGKAKIGMRFEHSISAPTKSIELADPVTYMSLHSKAVLTRDPLGSGMLYSQEKIARTREGMNPYVYPVTDWRKELIRNYTRNSRMNLNVSGGGGIARYYVAGSFNQDNGLLKVGQHSNFNNNINLKSYTLRSNVNIDVTKSTEMIVRLSGAFDDYNGPISGGTGTYRNIMRTNPVLFPAYYPKDDDHRFTNHLLFGNYDADGGYYLNPYAELVKGYKEYSRSTMLAQFEIKQDLSSLVRGLDFTTMVNTTRNSYFDISRHYDPFFYSIGSYDKIANTYKLAPLNVDDGTEYLGFSQSVPEINSSFYLQSVLNYNNIFNRHTVGGMLVYIMQQNLKAIGHNSTLQSSLPHRNIGLSGKVSYSYADRYFAEFNFGYNGSERFHESYRFGLFPSAGLAWNIWNENFFAPFRNTISNLRIRGTYGLIGQDAIGSATDRFFYLSQVNMNSTERGAVFGTDNGYSRSGVDVNRYSNPEITWETSTKSNIALELGLWGKIDFIGEYFREYRENILMTRAFIPSTMGLSAPMRANVGEAASHGVDLSLNYRTYFTDNLWIEAMGNFTYAANEYKVYEEPVYNEVNKSRIGYSVRQQWGYIAERLFIDDNEVANSPLQDFGSDVMGGDIKYHDVNKDGQITPLDQVPLGYPTMPEIVYGFGASIGFRNFDVSAFFQGLARESFWIDVEATAPFVSYRYDKEVFTGDIPNPTLQNQLIKAYADDHWSEEDQDLYALWPRLSTTPNANNNQTSSWFMRDGSFLRLKSAEIGYTLPQHLADRLRMEKFRFYVNGTNLMAWSKFKLWDVEMAGNGLGYPLQRVVNVGVNVTF